LMIILLILVIRMIVIMIVAMIMHANECQSLKPVLKKSSHFALSCVLSGVRTPRQFHGCNWETSSGRTLNLHTEMRGNPRERVQLGSYWHRDLFLGKKNGGTTLQRALLHLQSGSAVLPLDRTRRSIYGFQNSIAIINKWKSLNPVLHRVPVDVPKTYFSETRFSILAPCLTNRFSGRCPLKILDLFLLVPHMYAWTVLRVTQFTGKYDAQIHK
jgi:type IV secretory pathway VirB3-like protein